ncbi:MAG: cobalamin biosynthesis protein CobD [Lachnospiraceae bacterium]|jgi:adenosylcobinamide-phosphate synthase|nr:cobalamin biosynthesis protein CobD [Lachnospiraceae bacterium]NBJ81265.1 cobalamin biosynthesis protein CobD [bacterium 1XD42-76]NBK04708.1 cobalamin biosynthesis protein CobD [bacterium 1XD42-94]
MDRLILAGVIAAGFFLDQIFGDPQFLYHPVRLIGHLLTGCERILRRFCKEEPDRLLVCGLFLAVAVNGVTVFTVWMILRLCGAVSCELYLCVSILFCYQLTAVKALKTESMKVYQALKENDLEKARKALSMIVGRDTDRLDRPGIVRATVETVAENTSDGVVAPLFYLALGGPVTGWLYKAVNTGDSMVGYKNERYLYFGRAAAKLDDLLNYIPARLSAGLMILASALLGMNWRQAMKTFFRDRYHHASPNSAQTEAVCAGALGIMLGGDAYYFGTLHHKQTIGENIRDAEAGDIRRANRLLYMTSYLMLALTVIFEVVLYWFW